MAVKLKDISKYSTDVISLVVNDVLTTGEKRNLNKYLQKIDERLTGAEKSSQKVSKFISDEKVFMTEIAPKLMKRAQELEDLSDQGKVPKVIFDFHIKTDLNGLNLHQLCKEHSSVLDLEGRVVELDNIVKFYRGQIYIYIYKCLVAKDKHFKTFVEDELKLSYAVCMRYMGYWSLICKFPRLISCGLFFTQIIKHKRRLLKFFADEGKETAAKLSTPYDVVVQGRRVHIEYYDTPVLDRYFATSADWREQDSLAKMPSTSKDEQFLDAASNAISSTVENEDDELAERLSGMKSRPDLPTM